MPVYLPCFHTLNVLEKKNITEKHIFFSWSEPTRQPRLSGIDVAACAAGRGLVSPDSPGRLGLDFTHAQHGTSTLRELKLTKARLELKSFFCFFVCFVFFLYITLNAQNITNPHSSCIASSSSSSLPSCSGRPPGGAEEPGGEALTKVGAQHQPSVVVIFFFSYY